MGWAWVALADEEREDPPTERRQRRNLILRTEELWQKICQRRAEDIDLVALGELVQIPRPVSEAAQDAVGALQDELRSVDEAILPQRAEVVACQLVEDRIIRGALQLPQSESDETDSDPEKAAEEVFRGKSRPEGADTEIDEVVGDWIYEAYWHFRESGMGSEKAKDKVLHLAEANDYHFSRKSIGRYADI